MGRGITFCGLFGHTFGEIQCSQRTHAMAWAVPLSAAIRLMTLSVWCTHGDQSRVSPTPITHSSATRSRYEDRMKVEDERSALARTWMGAAGSLCR